MLFCSKSLLDIFQFGKQPRYVKKPEAHSKAMSEVRHTLQRSFFTACRFWCSKAKILLFCGETAWFCIQQLSHDLGLGSQGFYRYVEMLCCSVRKSAEARPFNLHTHTHPCRCSSGRMYLLWFKTGLEKISAHLFLRRHSSYLLPKAHRNVSKSSLMAFRKKTKARQGPNRR